MVIVEDFMCYIVTRCPGSANRRPTWACNWRATACRRLITCKRIAVLSGLVKEIELLACGPARTRPGAENTAADGWRFCRELAAHTNGAVLAATQTQYYQMAWRTHQIDFGAWEGPVMKFAPSGGASRAQ